MIAKWWHPILRRKYKQAMSASVARLKKKLADEKAEHKRLGIPEPAPLNFDETISKTLSAYKEGISKNLDRDFWTRHHETPDEYSQNLLAEESKAAREWLEVLKRKGKKPYSPNSIGEREKRGEI